MLLTYKEKSGNWQKLSSSQFIEKNEIDSVDSDIFLLHNPVQPFFLKCGPKLWD